MAHSDLNYWRGLQQQISQAPSETKPALQALQQVFSLTTILDGLSPFAGHSFLTAQDVKYLKRAQDAAIEAFVPYIETILDAFSFTDFETNSVLCRSGKTPYEAIVDLARNSHLNDARFMWPTMISTRSVWKKYEGAKL